MKRNFEGKSANRNIDHQPRGNGPVMSKPTHAAVGLVVFGLLFTRWFSADVRPSTQVPVRLTPSHSIFDTAAAATPAGRDQGPRLDSPASAAPPSSPAPAHSLAGPFDLDSRRGLRAAVAARAPHGEIVTFTSDVRGLPAAANMALQLKRLRIGQHLVLADARETCETGHIRWPWLGCGWSAGLPGFETRYASGAGGATARLWSLWSAKWLLVARLAELRVNVLALDTDMLLQADPYTLLRRPPVSRFEMVIVPEGSRVNLGFLYVRGKRCQPGGGVASVLWDVVRRLRLFTEDWPLLARRGHQTSTAGLWDQGLFTDAIVSSIGGSLVYPYTYLQSPRTGVWASIRWPPANTSVANLSQMHVVTWRDRGDRRSDLRSLKRQEHEMDAPGMAHRPPEFLPPTGHPQREQWERRRHPLMWAPLRPLRDPVAHLRQRDPSHVTPGWLDARALPATGRPPMWRPAGRRAGASGTEGDAKKELLLATPDWLYCLVGRWAVTAGWPSLAPRAVCAVLHLVECRSQFGAWNANKAARPYVQRALGYWHLPEPPPRSLVPGGPPRAVRLARHEWIATGAAAGIGPLLNALQRLALVAAVSGRTPVVPSVPCSSRWLSRNTFGRAGVADDYVIQLPNATFGGYRPDETDGGAECHLALGGDKCMLPEVLPAWSRQESGAIAFLGQARPEDVRAPRVEATTLRSTEAAAPGCAGDAERTLTLDVAALRSATERHRDAPMLEVALSHGFEGEGGVACSAVEHLRASLTAEEARRLARLRKLCPGFFAVRGTQPTHLEWLHRRRKLV